MGICDSWISLWLANPWFGLPPIKNNKNQCFQNQKEISKNKV